MLENFQKIGEYRVPGSNPEYKSFNIKKTERLPIVYLFIVEGKIKYIGETRQGYIRPLSYNKNSVMKRQHDAIFDATSSGKVVEVFACYIPTQKVTINGLEVDAYLAQDYEKALIQEIRPEWNGRT